MAMLDARVKEMTCERIKDRLEHITGEARQGIYALQHGDEQTLALSLGAIQRVCLEALRQLREVQR
jgi:hypothetical protein